MRDRIFLFCSIASGVQEEDISAVVCCHSVLEEPEACLLNWHGVKDSSSSSDEVTQSNPEKAEGTHKNKSAPHEKAFLNHYYISLPVPQSSIRRIMIFK